MHRVFISSFVYIHRRIQNFQNGGAKTKARAPTYYLAKFRRKLHENEENLTEGRGTRTKFYYEDPPLN